MTDDELQRAIEFLLKSQANTESRLAESDRQWHTQLEETKLQWRTQFEESDRRWETRFQESNRLINVRFEETALQIAHTNQQLEALAETQSEFTQTMLNFITLQTEFNAWTRKAIGELSHAVSDLRQEVSDLRQDVAELTRAVNNLIKFSSGNGNLRTE